MTKTPIACSVHGGFFSPFEEMGAECPRCIFEGRNALRAHVAELEAMPEGWKVHSLKLDAMEAERDRYRRTLERLRDAEDCPAIVKAIVNESLNP